MQIGKKQLFYVPGILLILTLFYFCMPSYVYATIPDGLIIDNQFKPGYGPSVGTMQLIQGRVVITHKGMQSGFIARKDHPLFQGDTIYTDKDARARFRLNDGSIMTLSSSTKLTINQSVYNPEKQERSSFLSLGIGKARFWVVKMLEYKNSNFKVKTSTFVAGVRGSDFIIIATPTRAELTALSKTEIDVIPLAAPDTPPVRVKSFQKTTVKQGGPAQAPVRVPMKKIKELMTYFTLQGEEEGPGENKHIKKDEDTDAEEKPKKEVKPEDMQIPPEALGMLEKFRDQDIPIPIKKVILKYMEKPKLDKQSLINAIIEDVELALPPLPDMPKTPAQ